MLRVPSQIVQTDRRGERGFFVKKPGKKLHSDSILDSQESPKPNQPKVLCGAFLQESDRFSLYERSELTQNPQHLLSSQEGRFVHY